MIKENNIWQKTQSIPSEFSISGKIISVLTFLEINLHEFSEKYEKEKEDDEWILNEKLFELLNIQSRNMLFQFIPEYKYKNKSKPDFGIKEVKKNEIGRFVCDFSSEHFFDIECKRLYDVYNNDYVRSGIQRFKENRHGVDFPQSAMIGYVETNDFDYWHTKVNSWIHEPDEKLKLISNSVVRKLQSRHLRKDSNHNAIDLTHFWIQINCSN